MNDKVNAALSFARIKHDKQLDNSGEPYINHPIRVATILQEVTSDEDIICAAVLHDTIEDTNTEYNELQLLFGKRVADLVMEVTHEGKKDEKGYYFPRLKSKEGILIKFADRLDNLSRMQSWNGERQQQYLKKSKFWKSE